MKLLKSRKIVALALVTAIVLILLHINAGSYKMPEGYAFAKEVWQQKGVDDPFGREVDGSNANPYDVIVWGSDPEGIAAALSAARNGLHTLLIDHRDRVGGLFIVGELNFIDMNYDDNKNLVTKGIFEEFYKKVGGMVFDIDKGQRVFEEMLAAEELLTVKLNYQLIHPQIDELQTSVTSIKVRDSAGNERDFYGKIFIDASQDADLAYMAGVPFTMGFEDIGLPGKFQASTLVFRIVGVNWYRVMWETLLVDRRSSSKATFKAAWGYDDHIRKYQPESDRISFRGFNMARQKDGQVLINGLLIYGVDAANPQSRADAKELAKSEAYRFIEYARKNLPGFEKASISGFADELYVRQTRHMKGLYRMTIDDVLENRDHWDRIGYGGYPVDIQAVDKHFPGIVIGEPSKYALPFRTMVPLDVNNLLVVGRSASYDSLAHGSARIVGVGMAGAQAAGAASAYSLATKRSFQEIAASQEDLEFIRGVLADQGALVKPWESKPPKVAGHEHYPAMQELRRLGVIVGGYNNNYMLDDPLSIQAFLNLLFNGALRTLNLAGHGDLADKMYFVISQEQGDVNSDNIKSVFENFKRFNPHLNSLYTEADYNSFINNLPKDDEENSQISRGELYKYIADYLAMLK
ncbi:FAD-dependent oxidoreductase [Desulfitibacter alkalitolerans]|uniref:FAD-dependent oxidoreductase n=1 Tax=Desulfitibacter alkalitolerans TaxID=264641 RepID=UPI00068742B4|nr:FAD-dependent oxidoreductase [Desulfitibacter alkalitolerans]